MSYTKSNKVNRLIVLGNGFDLKCGLRSTFQNFISSDENNSEYSRILGAALAYSKSTSHWREDLEDLMGRKNGWYDGPIATELMSLVKGNPSDIWTAILLLKQNQILWWYDVEEIIKHVLVDEDTRKITNMRGNHWHNGLLNYLDKDEFCLITFLASYLYAFDIESQDFVTFLLDQLKMFEEKFKFYLIAELERMQGVYSITSKNMLDCLSAGNGCKVLDFNYTMPGQNVSAFNRADYPVVNIHGSIQDHPIIGIDQRGILARQNLFQFTKTFRIMSRANGSNDGKNLPKPIDTIVFFGHSLNVADYSYFQSLFDYYDIYNQPIKLTFGYAAYGNLSADDVAEQQFHKIAQLFQTYGETLSNVDHGKNLMHKLLLENRLIIKDYADAENHDFG
jgi:hypothetical protein